MCPLFVLFFSVFVAKYAHIIIDLKRFLYRDDDKFVYRHSCTAGHDRTHSEWVKANEWKCANIWGRNVVNPFVNSNKNYE